MKVRKKATKNIAHTKKEASFHFCEPTISGIDSLSSKLMSHTDGLKSVNVMKLLLVLLSFFSR